MTPCILKQRKYACSIRKRMIICLLAPVVSQKMKLFATLVLSIVIETGAGERRGGGKGGMVTHAVTWLLHYCGFVSHKQLVTTNFFNLHFDFVTCHKQLYHAYWVTPAYNSVPLPKYIRRQGTKTLICCLSAVAKITICLCCTTPESVFCCFGAGIF